MKTHLEPLLFSHVVLTLCVCLIVGSPTATFAERIDIDELLVETNSDNDPLPQQLVPLVEMTFDDSSKLLTVVVTNESCYAGGCDAGHLLTGVGFNLMPGVVIEDSGARNSAIWLPDGSAVVDPKNPGVIALSQNDWGYAINGAMGHFLDPAELTTNTVLSTMNSDAATTFAGNPASNDLMDSFDYGLQGLAPTPGHSKDRSIRNSIGFDLYLDGPAGTDWSNLIDYIQANPVVVSFGSPQCSTATVPEPAVSLMSLMVFAFALFLRRRTF